MLATLVKYFVCFCHQVVVGSCIKVKWNVWLNQLLIEPEHMFIIHSPIIKANYIRDFLIFIFCYTCKNSGSSSKCTSYHCCKSLARCLALLGKFFCKSMASLKTSYLWKYAESYVEIFIYLFIFLGVRQHFFFPSPPSLCDIWVLIKI